MIFRGGTWKYITVVKTNEWTTPQHLFDDLNEEFSFTLDPCSTDENAKCRKYYTVKDNGLIQDWSEDIVFMNPPYGRSIKRWVKKAYEESFERSNGSLFNTRKNRHDILA
nr:phage N-6-adenine-methyltransferase [Staphylococcus aureus]